MVATRDADAVRKIAGTLDLLVVTTNVPIDWAAVLGTLAPEGRMHVVGAVLEPILSPIVPVISGQ